MANPGKDYLNFSHLESLTEEVLVDQVPYCIVHIYAEAPDYKPAADPAEGTACVDDAARAAVVYLRHFEITGEEISRERAKALLRFVMYMQAADGLFYNFVVNNKLEINKNHFRSRADRFEWWAGRAIWALGTAVRALQETDPEFAETCYECIKKSLPHLAKLLERYPETREYHSRTMPAWLINECAADATSEMLLGLVPLNQARPDTELQMMISRFAEGLALMRYGSVNVFPYGPHASNKDGWHKWGNSQTQVLAEAGIVSSAKLEAEQFYSRLLVEGWMHSIVFDELHATREFERVAYGIRTVVVGLVRLYEATGEANYAKMAGLAASWFMGNNVTGEPMYDPATGRGYDGLHGEGELNYNSGAESTIETLYSLLEVQQHPEARAWLHAKGQAPTRVEKNENDYFYRVFEVEGGNPRCIAVVMNLTQERLEVFEGEELDSFLGS